MTSTWRCLVPFLFFNQFALNNSFLNIIFCYAVQVLASFRLVLASMDPYQAMQFCFSISFEMVSFLRECWNSLIYPFNQSIKSPNLSPYYLVNSPIHPLNVLFFGKLLVLINLWLFMWKSFGEAWEWFLEFP